MQWRDAAAMLVLLAAVAALYATTPRSADFWWSDAPRHAMDGAFYHDLVRDLPLGNLREYTMQYYLKYPALTILFYPPVFALVEAAFFAVLGVSHATAHVAVAAFNLAAAAGAYFLVRRRFTPMQSAAAAVLFLGLPEVAFWGRQVMLELPACAFMLWSSHVFLSYRDRRRPYLLYTAVLLLIIATYTKQTAVLLLPVFACLLWRDRGTAVLRSRDIRISAAALLIGILPLTLLTLRFGHVNFNSVAGGGWNPVPVLSWASISFYARHLPSQAGWPVVILAGLSAVLAMRERRLRSAAGVYMLLWSGIGYAFFSLIALKEPRHTVLILFPLAFFAVEGVRQALPGRLSTAGAAAFCAVIFVHTLYSQKAPAVTGYRAAVDYVAAHAPADGVVLFSGHRDGVFVFALRTREDRRDIAVLRSDKVFLRVVQRRELGLEEHGYTEAQIADMLDRYGVSYVVNEPSYWNDLETMQRLQRVLRSGRFEKVGVVPVASNMPHTDRELEIYRRAGPVRAARERIRLELPIIDAIVEGTLGGVK
jgi:hypothetical protein